jgi:hypothetical protein
MSLTSTVMQMDRTCEQCKRLIPDGDTFILDFPQDGQGEVFYCETCGPRPATLQDLQEAYDSRVREEEERTTNGE